MTTTKKEPRFKNYIVMRSGDKEMLVSGTSGDNAFCDYGAPAMEFTRRRAEEICEGLNMNFVPSYIITAPSYMEFKNPEESI